MDFQPASERDRVFRQLGQYEQRIRDLERLLSQEKQFGQPAVKEWQKLLAVRQDLFEWLVDQSIDTHGNVVHSTVDAALGGDDFVPCTFAANARDFRYRIELVSTRYRITAIDVGD